MIKLSDYVFKFIANQGVKHVFMLPGGGAMHLVDSLGSCPDLEYICVLHEQAATIAAEAYARVTNNLGVALVTTGPGGTNAITGVAGAWLESTPCLIISGQVKRPDMKGNSGVRQLGPQELDIVTIVQSITKYAVTVTDPLTIRYHLEKAAAIAKVGRPGPVWIDIPLDIQAAQIDMEQLPAFDSSELDALVPSSVDLPALVAQVIDTLNSSDRPVLFIGNGVRVANAQDVLLELVEVLGIPVQTTWVGADLLPHDHRLNFGEPGAMAGRGANFTIQNCDCLLAIGVRLDFPVTGFNQATFAREAKKIVVDIDPSEIAKLQMPVHIPVQADARQFIEEMLRQKLRLQAQDRDPWFTRCERWKTKYPPVLPEYCNAPELGINIYTLFAMLSEESAEDDFFISGSSGTAVETFWFSYVPKFGQRAFCTNALGAMGFGIPAAMGGSIGGNRRRTITVDGDGGFQMNIQELETVARLQLPVKYFVINNQGYASIRAMQRGRFDGHLVACDRSSGLTLPDVTKQAAAYGIHAVRLDNHNGLRERIREILAFPGPVICEVMAPPTSPTSTRTASIVRPDGSMESKPIEDLSPLLDRDEFFENMIIPPLTSDWT